MGFFIVLSKCRFAGEIMFPKVVSKSDSDIQLKTDDEVISLFYQDYKATTRASFEREIRRFMYWAKSQELTLRDVTFMHVKLYRDMLEDVPDCVISDKTTKYYKNKETGELNPDWRPFKQKKLSPKSIRAAMRLLSSFGNWLLQHEYLNANPFALVRKNAPSEKAEAVKRIESDVDTSHHFTPIEMYWITKVLSDKIELAKTEKERFNWIRLRFIFVFLRRTGLRRAELTGAHWEHIKRETRDDGVPIQVLKGIGKGDKDFGIPLHDEALEVLQEYKRVIRALNVNNPEFKLTGPILRNKSGKKGITPTTLHMDVKKMFAEVAGYIEEHWRLWETNLDNRTDFETLIDNLRDNATIHWLRHSAITENGGVFKDLKTLKEFARHSSINTTDLYWHTTNSELHKEISKV